LIEAFKINVGAYQAEAKKAAKEFVYHYHRELDRNMEKVPKMLYLFIDDAIADDVPFGRVRKDAFALLQKDKIVQVNNYIEQNHVDEDEKRWQYYGEIQRKITLNIRHLFKCLDFHNASNTTTLMETISAVKSIFKTGKTLNQVPIQEIPKKFIPQHLKKYIIHEGKLSSSRYEMLLYTTIRNQIEAGNLFIKDSFQHKSFEEDLLSDEKWENKEDILKSLDIPKLSKPIETLLSDWEKLIEEKYKVVNQALSKGENKAITMLTKKDGSTKWKLKYEPEPEPYNHQIYQQFPRIGVISLLKWVDEQTNFLSAFTHMLGRRATKKLNKESALACLIGYGTNQGLSALSDRCDISFHELNGTAYNFIRQETLRDANKILVDNMAEQPMFDYYNNQKGTIHSSSDGQKFGTLFDTINARYSAKYFGLSKGIPIYTLVANHIPVNAKVIGANEYEGHFVFDLLYNNPTKVKPQIHSTDMHGINQVNFAILDFFGYQFAPRFTQISSELDKLNGFQSMRKYNKYMLRPSHKINKKLIIEEWDNIQRIIASLALKTTTQSTIIRKLSSYKRNNRTQQALWQYDKLIKTYFLLNYVHSKALRKNVQKALNRGEGYHRLRRKVAYDNEGKFRVHSRAEQHIWSDAGRLIANAILFYNLHLLSGILESAQAQSKVKQLELLKRISPVAWRHINIYGTYQFLETVPQLDLSRMVNDINIDALFRMAKTK
jgi:TnpA family transposase